MQYPLERTMRVLLAVAVAFAAGCDRGGADGATSSASAGATENESGSASGAEDESTAEGPLVAKSDDLSDDPRRIVSLAPNITEILFELGVGDRVVAVTSHCDYPEAATEKPSVGTFANPDFETIVAKKPDLVVGVVSGGDRGVFERLKSVDLPHAFVRMETVEETVRGIETVGELVGRHGEAASLAASLERRLDRLRSRWAGEPARRVLLVYGHEPLVAAGPGTFGHQLLEAAGADNVLADAGTQYPRLDIEKVVESSPEVIVDTATIANPDDGDFWASHTSIEAVRQDRVRYLTDPVVLRPGPRLPEALRRIGGAIHGDGNDGGGR